MSKVSAFISSPKKQGKVFYKKGSLELSVNAIVILVLAIAMLGVGLLFIRSKFGQIADVIEVEAPEKPGNSQDPIGLSSETIKVSRFKDLSLKVNFFNPGGRNYWVPKLNCAKMRVQVGPGQEWNTDANDGYLPITVIPQKLDGGQNANFQIIIPKEHFRYKNGQIPSSQQDNAFLGKDVCELAFYPCGDAAPAPVTGQEYDYASCLTTSKQVPITKQIILDVS